MKSLFEQIGGTYTQVGDYLLAGLFYAQSILCSVIRETFVQYNGSRLIFGKGKARGVGIPL